jgi:hypothetical protein
MLKITTESRRDDRKSSQEEKIFGDNDTAPGCDRGDLMTKINAARE